MGKEIAIQVQETWRVPNRINPRQKTPRQFVYQINKDQTQKANIKSSKGKATTHKGIPIMITADLSIELFRPEGNGRTY